MYPKTKRLTTLVNGKIKAIKLRLASYFMYKIGMLSFKKRIKLNKYNFILELSTTDLGLSRQLWFTGWREYSSTKYFISYLEKSKPSVVLELGANVGYFACIEKAVLPESTIICVEPVKKNYLTLLNNIGLNEYKKITAENIGIGVRSETNNIYTFKYDNWATFNYEHAVDLKNKGFDYKVEEVEIKTLTEFITPYDTKVDLLRMDVESYEYEIITNNINFFKEQKTDIFFEFHTNLLGKIKTLEILHLLRELGYVSAVTVFNYPYCKSDEYFKYPHNPPSEIHISKLISIIDSYTDESIKQHDGFELFISKRDKIMKY